MDELDHLIRQHVERTVDAEKVPPGALRKAKKLLSEGGISCPHCGKPITPFKKPRSKQRLWNLLWLCLAIGTFSTSFVFRHYFFQWLVLALFFGFKWILEQRTSRTQVLIYKALREEEGAGRLKDLHKTSSQL